MTKTTDLALASYLLANGHSLTGTEGPPGRTEFVFEDVPEDTVLNFYSSDANTNARKVLDAFRSLKGLAANLPRMNGRPHEPARYSPR